MYDIYPISLENITNLCTVSTRVDESSVDFAEFYAGCSLIQTSTDEWIFTGPIVLFTDVENLSVTVTPGGRSYAFVDAEGNLISAPVPGQPFFIRVPNTRETYMLTLYGFLDACPVANGTPLSQMPAGSIVRSTLRDMMEASGRSPKLLLSEGQLPDCYDIFAKMSFYVNQRPVMCRRRRCVTMPGTVGGTTGSIAVPCCNCQRSC